MAAFGDEGMPHVGDDTSDGANGDAAVYTKVGEWLVNVDRASLFSIRSLWSDDAEVEGDSPLRACWEALGISNTPTLQIMLILALWLLLLLLVTFVILRSKMSSSRY